MNTEQVFTSPDGFGVTTPTPPQIAAARMLNGRPVGDVAGHPDVLDAFGGPEAVAALPVGEAPREVHLVSGSRTGKSALLAADIMVASQTVDVSGTSVGDIVRISIVGLKLATNAIWTHLARTIEARPKLRQLRIGEPTADTLVLRHPCGRPIEVMLVPLDKWGGSIVSVYSAGVYVDEESRMIGAEDGPKNWTHAHTAAQARLLPGAKFCGAGAPFAPMGPIYDLVGERFGAPGSDIVIMRGTGPAWNPSWWTPRRCAELEQRNPTAYQTDVLGEFAAAEQGLLSALALKKNTRETPLEALAEDDAMYGAAVDVGRHRWTLVIVEAFESTDDLPAFKVVLAREIVTQSPDAAWHEIAAHCRRYSVTDCSVDQYAAGESAAIAKRFGLQLTEKPWTAKSRLEQFSDLATLIHSDRVELAPERTLLRDLRSVKKRATQQGFTIILPQTSDGRHADFAPALAAAVKAGTQRARAVDIESFHEINNSFGMPSRSVEWHRNV